MTIISVLFDQPVSMWRPTAADLDRDNDCRYLASPPPLRMILVVAGGVTAKPGFVLDELHNKVWECSIGKHGENAPIGQTLPGYARLWHVKIMVHNRLPRDRHETTLSALMSSAPFGSEGAEPHPNAYLRGVHGSDDAMVSLPIPIWEKIRHQARIRHLSPDTFLWHVMMEWVADHD